MNILLVLEIVSQLRVEYLRQYIDFLIETMHGFMSGLYLILYYMDLWRVDSLSEKPYISANMSLLSARRFPKQTLRFVYRLTKIRTLY